MKKYEKPVVMINEELAEGVYAASGDCYSVSFNILQGPGIDQLEYYVIQLNLVHNALDGHHSSERRVKIEFNQVVTHKGSNASSWDGDGTTILTLTYKEDKDKEWHYHNNSGGSIGLGNLELWSNPGLAINKIYCEYCSQVCNDRHKPDGQ